MESWILQLLLAVGTIVASFAVVKANVKTHNDRLDIHDNVIEKLFGRLDRHGDDLVALNTKSKSAVTLKDVAEEFVRKELYVQYQNHMDSKFRDLKSDVAKSHGLIEKIYISVNTKDPKDG